MTDQGQSQPLPRRSFSTAGTVAARSLLGLPQVPTVVAVGPFDDQEQTDQLTGAFAAVRLRCKAQIVFFWGEGGGSRWPDLIAAADVVAATATTGPEALLDVMARGRPIVAPASPATAQLVIPGCAGLIYRQGDVMAMGAALLRLLTSPVLRHGMSCRAREVARQHMERRTAVADAVLRRASFCP